MSYMKNYSITIGLFAVIILSGCSYGAVVDNASSGAETAPVITVNEEGETTFNTSQLGIELAKIESGDLSNAEKDGLVYMREEEKLAHDVYVYLYDKWGQRIFSNIAASEATHTDAVKKLLEKYGLDDPSSETVPGEFQNDVLQKLYNDLVARGSESLSEALLVGVAIEEIDILDLEKFLIDVDSEDVTLVYENLLRGSRNHLRAFIKNLDKQGVVYEPQYLNESVYQEIINASMEKGSGGFGKKR